MGEVRELTIHKHKGVSDVTVQVLDEPGHGGACHEYQVTWACSGKLPNPGCDGTIGFRFQNGPIAEVGVNGITHETLLAILIDRLEHFQSGEYTCLENEQALYHIREAMGWLHHRKK